MLTRQYKKRRFGRFVLPAITAAFLAYFGYHSIHGEFGLKATEKFLQQKAERQQKLAELQHRRKALERQVAALSDGRFLLAEADIVVTLSACIDGG